MSFPKENEQDVCHSNSSRWMRPHFEGIRVFWDGIQSLHSAFPKTILPAPHWFIELLPKGVSFEAIKLNLHDWNFTKLIALDSPLRLDEKYEQRLDYLRKNIRIIQKVDELDISKDNPVVHVVNHVLVHSLSQVPSSDVVFMNPQSRYLEPGSIFTGTVCDRSE